MHDSKKEHKEVYMQVSQKEKKSAASGISTFQYW